MNILIVGSGGGLGNVLSVGLQKSGRHLFLLSYSQPSIIQRSNAKNYTWIKGDPAILLS